MGMDSDAAEEEDTNDPDYIAAHPPNKVASPEEYFKQGPNEGKWLEYDERGVPTKTIKKKKITKKEKDALEMQYLEAKKQHIQYLQDVEAWEQRKQEAEAALEHSDRLRWAFRQVGSEKNAPLSVAELEELFRVMGWAQLTRKEVSLLQKRAGDLAEEEGLISLAALRTFVAEQMAMHLLEERLRKGAFDNVALEEVYSPRAWRQRLEEVQGTGTKAKKERKAERKTTRRAADDGGASSSRGRRGPADSPRRGDADSPRGSRGGTKDTRGRSSADSPRGRKGGGDSPRGKKEKKEKKEKR